MDTTRRVPGRAYQTVRDPERLLIEERAEALSAAGNPLPDDDPAKYAERRLKEARAARRLSCSDICLSSFESQGTADWEVKSCRPPFLASRKKMKYSLLEGARVEATPKARGVCSFCGSQTVAKCGNHVVWHWAHKRLDNCDPWWETETAWHRDWKNMFPTEWQEVVLQASSGERHIADVRTPSGMVIEFQRSTIHPEEVIARQNYYQNMIWVIDGTRTEFDRYNFRMGLSKVSENGLASFSWHSRSKLFARWWVSKPVFIDFGPDFGIWRVLRFDPTQKRGVVAYTHKEKLVEWITNGTTDFSFNGGPASDKSGTADQ